MKINQRVWLRKDGAVFHQEGFTDYPEQGVWSSDDRILAFWSQKSGGLDSLIYHGKQPQSANAFLLRNPSGALKVSWMVKTRDGCEVIPHRFKKTILYPFGWENTFFQNGIRIQSRLCVQGHTLILNSRCQNLREETVEITPILKLDPAALEKNVNGKRIWREDQSDKGSLCLVAHDQLQTSTWIKAPGFKDYLLDAETYILITSDDLDTRVEDWSLMLSNTEVPPYKWGRSVNFFILCGDSTPQIKDTLAHLRREPANPWKEQLTRSSTIAKNCPRLQISRFRFADAIYRLSPLYTEATKVNHSGALRSSAGGYYFVWGWDSLMAGHELNRYGDREGALHLLDFIANHRAEDGSIPHRFDNDLRPLQVVGFGFVSLLFISLLYQYYCETVDVETLNCYYPVALLIFNEIASSTDERGFFPCLGMYPDAPLKLGRTPQSNVSYEIGFWYCACRMMEILADRRGDCDTSRIAISIADRLYATFLDSFYDPILGFLVDSRGNPGNEANGTYPRYSLFPLHNAFGAWLLRPVLKNIGSFVKKELMKPDGIRMVPAWDPHSNSETVTGNCWFLHFDLYCLKAFRRIGDGLAVEKWLNLANAFFTKRCVIPELQTMVPNSTIPANWEGPTGQIWQLFAMSGWVRGLLEGVVGIETDIGGLTYFPCKLSSTIRMDRFPFRDGIWKILVNGNGSWVTLLKVDGEIILGSLKIPGEMVTPGEHTLEVERSMNPTGFPLLLEATGATVHHPKVENRRLTLWLEANNQVNIIFFCPFPPVVTMNGVEINGFWDPETNNGSFSWDVHGMWELVIGEK
jgi:hypothetical protein